MSLTQTKWRGKNRYLLVIGMTTWRDGMDVLDREQGRDRVTLAHFVRQLRDKKIPRQEGAALFLTRLQGIVPPLIADHVRRFGGFYNEVVALTVRFLQNRPRIKPKQRSAMRHLGPGFWHPTVSFGFVEVLSAFAIATMPVVPAD